MSFQTLTTATTAVRNSGDVFANLSDRVGLFALLVLGLIMGGATALSGL